MRRTFVIPTTLGVALIAPATVVPCSADAKDSRTAEQ
jgi:hypothetical protein